MDEARRKVSEGAYAIWEREGRPEGRAEQHWSVAEGEIRAATDASLTLRDRVNKLYQLVESSFDAANNTKPTEEVQIELGRWTNIASNLVVDAPSTVDSNPTTFIAKCKHAASSFTTENVDRADMLRRTEVAVNLLIKDPASLPLVRELRFEITNDLIWNGGPFQRILIRLTGGSTSMTVVWGALFTTIIGIPSLLFLFSSLDSRTSTNFLQLRQEIIVGTAVPAFLGAVVSILARLSDFDGYRNTDPKVLFMTAFFKPYIGMVTGLFIVSALAIGIGSIGDVTLVPAASGEWPTPKVFYFLYAVGFLAGFSERFTTDFVERAEERFGGGVPGAGPGRSGD
jgi:Protein of unknown function (DUF2934)